jgi:hypothetical protein
MQRRPKHLPITALSLALMGILSTSAIAETNTDDRLKALEQRLNTLESENRALKDQVRQTEQKVEATGTQVERISSLSNATATATTFGGYGELHLNKLKNKLPGGADKNEMDFHRFVLFMGHQFNDRLRFFSELEVEHNTVEGGNGAVELEQAYLDFTLNDLLSIKAGSFLVPVGIINETHEPPTFYGVERNPVETSILPGTWWEGGAAVTANLGAGLTLVGAVTSGMKATAADNYDVRLARQELAQGTQAKNPAYTARLKWTAIPGIELAASIQRQTDITQSTDTTAGAALLREAHLALNKGAFGLRMLYAGWNLNGSGPKAVGADRQNGWYVEPSWKFTEQWGVFARRSNWDNRAGDTTDSRHSQTDLGVNYWPHPDVVVKLDHQKQRSPNGQDVLDGFNLGLGYQF